MVQVMLNGKPERTLYETESAEFYIYDSRSISVSEVEVNTTSDGYLPPYQRRVVDEKAELDEKISLLGNFTLTTTFLGLHSGEQKRLQDQRAAMGLYSGILGERIAAFSTGV
jgi:hypothetical protein